MSKERFDWIHEIGAEVIATPGCKSNVKEIFDKTNERKQNPLYMIFNQFEEMGNPLWHYNVTGNALADVFEAIKRPGDQFAGTCFTSGSVGTMSTGDRLKELYPHLKLGVGEVLQCPTILNNGFGGHRIAGIASVLLHCMKMAKYYEFTAHGVVSTVLTDSAAMYGSRIAELNEMHGAYNATEAVLDHNLHDNLMELTYTDRKRVYNLEVLHLDGAARQDLRGSERPVVMTPRAPGTPSTPRTRTWMSLSTPSGSPKEPVIHSFSQF